MTTLGFFENLLDDQVMMESDLKSDKMDLLSTSIQESGLFNEGSEDWSRISGLGPDAFLDSILTGSNDEIQEGFDRPLSDTSSDSGCTYDGQQQLLSPEPPTSSANNKVDLIEYISNPEDDEDGPLHAVVNPRTNSPEPDTVFDTGATTIILPVITPKSVKVVKSAAAKRRRVSASSNDSGVDGDTRPSVSSQKRGKYPPLELSEEERRICEREGIKLPSHYPLSREEERNLKRIRRKIRNKVSAQDSRKRKKEYLDSMEDRVRACSEENDELHKRIEQLESQNKTLASQLKRLHQIIVSGGFTTRQNQTSTAMMVLLLSTALFLIPGFKDHQEPQKSEVDISQAIKMPPMPGQSRSLLQFAPNLQEEFNVVQDKSNVASVPTIESKPIFDHIKEEPVIKASPFHDHDYFIINTHNPIGSRKKEKVSYIVADVPPQGYGFVDNIKEEKKEVADNDVFVVVEENGESQLNVNVTGLGNVVLHVPKDIK